APRQPVGRRQRAVIVEAHAVDQRAVARQAKQPRPGIAGLRLGGDRADLDEAEPDGEQRARTPGVLVEPGGEPEGPGQLAAERVHAERRVVRRQPAPHRALDPGQRHEDAQQRERQPVRALGRQPAQHEPVEQSVHGGESSRDVLRIVLDTGGAAWLVLSWRVADFVFATCLPGMETALKLDVARARPELRLAYSRPGLVTFKSTRAVAPDDTPGSVFARVWGRSVGAASDPATAALQLAPLGATRVHVFARETETAEGEPHSVGIASPQIAGAGAVARVPASPLAELLAPWQALGPGG